MSRITDALQKAARLRRALSQREQEVSHTPQEAPRAPEPQAPAAPRYETPLESLRDMPQRTHQESTQGTGRMFTTLTETVSAWTARARAQWESQGRAIWSRYRQPAIAFGVGLVAVIGLGSLFLKPSYTASTTIVVTEAGIRNEWDLFQDESRDVDFEEQVRSRAVLGPALRQLGLFPPAPKRVRWWEAKPPSGELEQQALMKVVKDFQRSLTVARLRHSGILRVAVTAGTPTMAADLANAVARSFIEYRRSLAITRAQRLLEAINAERAAIQAEVNEITVEQNQFLASHGWDNYESELQLGLSRVGQLKTSLRSLEGSAGPLGSLTVFPLALDRTEQPQAAMIDETSLAELARQLGGADAKLGYAKSRYKEGNPIVLQAQRQKVALEQVLIGRINDRRAVLERRLADEQQRLQRLLAEQPQAQTFHTAITHAQQRYRELLDQRAQTRLSLTRWKQPSATFERFSILDEAVPPRVRSLWAGLLSTLAATALLVLVGLLTIPALLHVWGPRLWHRLGRGRSRSATLPDTLPEPLPRSRGYERIRPPQPSQAT